jgi:hypothetical protein
MPDQYGRPTIADGLQVAQAFNWAQENEAKNQDRRTAAEAYQVADAMANKKDTSNFTPQARFAGAKLYWDSKLGELKTKSQEQLNTTQAMQQTMTRLDLNLKVAGERLRQYQLARSMGDDKRAKEIAIQLNNENMYNGHYVKPNTESGGYDVTTWGGKTEKIDDMPITQVDQLLGAYFNKPYDEIMQWQMGAEQLRRQKNEEILARAEPWINDKTGQIIYKIPAGIWAPDGQPRDAHFVDDPMAQRELTPEQTKGFTKLDVASKKAAVMGAQKEMNKPGAPINPDMVVQSGGQTGLIIPGEGGKPAAFTPIQGGAGKLSIPKGKAASEKSSYDLKVKQLETELMPFVEKGQSVIDPQTLAITNNGNNALKTAMSIVQKNEQDPKQLSDAEKKLLPNAQRAVAMYQQLSQMNAQSYGLQTQGGGEGGGLPAPAQIQDTIQGYMNKGRQMMTGGGK